MAKREDLKGRNVKMYNREHLTEEDILHKINNVEVEFPSTSTLFILERFSFFHSKDQVVWNRT